MRRSVDLLEYQGKTFLTGAGVAVPAGLPAESVDEAVTAGDSLGYPVVVKAQVRTGGRGKAGGVKLAADAAELRQHGEAILGMDIAGHEVAVLWIEQACSIASEHYASFTYDRGARRYLALLAAEGGVDIESLIGGRPDAISRLHIDPLEGLSSEAARHLVSQAGMSAHIDEISHVVVKLFTAFVEGDAELVEVNPLVVTTDGKVLALDAKVTLDDNAAYRHPEWSKWNSAAGRDPREAMALEAGLNYVGLDGTVGVIGNGAGLVMATLDLVEQVGGRAANFLDVGGGASAAVITAALDLVDHDEKVRCILVNVFGGITRCDEVARGIVEAVGSIDLASPLVVRLDGTNAVEGRAILAERQMARVVSCPTMVEAAKAAVMLAASEDL